MNQDKKILILIVIACILTGACIGATVMLLSMNKPDAQPIVPEVRVEQTVPATVETLPPETTAPIETTQPETIPPETEPPKVTIDTVPQYFQTDYPDVRYGTGTIANSGCNMTALAMVATYMTDHVYYPDEMADYLAHFLGNHHERLAYGSELLQLSFKRAVNVNETLAAVREGKVAIVLKNNDGVFTTGQHFIVLYGVNEDNKILVHDPNERNYTINGLGTYFENGFPDGKIIAGYAGGWIYDKSAMPEEPFIYEPEPRPEPRYGDLELTGEEMDLIAKLLCMEAGSEPFDGQQAIAEVILNRLASGKFGSSIHNILYAEGQFAAIERIYLAKPTYSQYKAIENALYGPYILPMDVVFFATFKVNDKEWGKIGSHYFCYEY